MLQVLVESGAMRPRRTSWTAVSVVAHAAILALAVYATVRPDTGAAEGKIPLRDIIYVPLTQTEVPRAAGNPIPTFGIPQQSFTMPRFDMPSVTTPVPNFVDRVLDDIRNMSVGSPVGTRTGTVAAPGAVYEAESVDRMVVPMAGNGSPPYPARLAAAGIEGDVVARFVVDTTGRVEPRSIQIVEASHPNFGDSVVEWLKRTRYSPALVNGRPVRQLVQQRVGFSLTR